MWHSGLRFIIPVRIRYNKIISLVTGVIVDLSEKILSRLKLRQLRVIVAIEDFSSLKGAAEFLGLSQPTVTKTVQELEADFVIKLFDRTNRGVIATNYGVALTKHARLILAQVKHAGEELSDVAAGLGGRVAIGTLVAAAASVVPRGHCHVKRSDFD